MTAPRVAIEPADARFPREVAVAAVEAGGGLVVGPDDAEALVWVDHAGPKGLNRLLHEYPNIRWVQLPWAGVEPYIGVIDDERTWTAGQGVYAGPVAELALTLLLAGLRGLPGYARASRWSGPRGRNLLGARVAVLGGGGIARSFLRLVGPFGADVTVVRRRPEPMAAAARVVGPDELDDAIDGAEGVIVALALTADTEGLLDRHRLERMAGHGWLVNVARGRHVVTEDLVAVLRAGAIGGAGLDVTDPEPLPADHPLWTLPNCIITPHVGNTLDMARPLLSARIAENVRHWAAGEPLVGRVDPDLGY
ncbi:MAG: NAD(P)-dependent oxidoreductase [Acidimicrobiales bacterium]